MTSPVSGSTSTVQMCVPNGYTKFDGSKNAVASSPGSTPGGRFQATLAIRASSPKVFPLSGEPFTANFPSCHSRSASLASSRWAAIFFALSFTRCAATFTALPHTAVVRLPYVPHPWGVASVSPATTSTFSTGMPNSSATICANVVSSPWPCGLPPM